MVDFVLLTLQLVSYWHCEYSSDLFSFFISVFLYLFIYTNTQATCQWIPRLQSSSTMTPCSFLLLSSHTKVQHWMPRLLFFVHQMPCPRKVCACSSILASMSSLCKPTVFWNKNTSSFQEI